MRTVFTAHLERLHLSVAHRVHLGAKAGVGTAQADEIHLRQVT